MTPQSHMTAPSQGLFRIGHIDSGAQVYIDWGQQELAAQIDALLEKCQDDKAAFAAVLADDMLALAKPADGAAEVKLKRLARVEQATNEPKSEIAASEKRERVLFVLEPAMPALQPSAPATAPPATIEAK